METSAQTIIPYSLSTDQKQLLITLVEYHNEGQLHNPIVLVPAGPSDYVVYVRGAASLRVQRISDFDALCAADLLSYRLTRMGNGKVYQLTKASLRAADLFRHLPPDLPPMDWATIVSEEETNARLNARLQLFKALRMRLRHSLVSLLPNAQLADVVSHLTAISRQLEGDKPDPERVTELLRILNTAIATLLTAENGRAIGEILITFGNLTQVVYQILDQLKRYRRF